MFHARSLMEDHRRLLVTHNSHLNFVKKYEQVPQADYYMFPYYESPLAVYNLVPLNKNLELKKIQKYNGSSVVGYLFLTNFQ